MRKKDMLYWAYKIRSQRDKLSPEAIQLLDSYNFPWVYINEEWDFFYNKLVNFFEKNQHFNVVHKGNEYLHYWIVYVRKAYQGKSGYEITEIQINKLNEIKFEWDASETRWNLYFRNLKKYKEHFGTCNVKRTLSTNALYGWCREMRIHKYELSDEKINKLNEIGFEWL